MTPHDEMVTLQYARWDEIFQYEKPYQIISDFEHQGKVLRNTNLQYGFGQRETIHDIRNNESQYTLDEHGFAVCINETRVNNFKDFKTIENEYLPEIERLLKKEVEGADDIFFFDWRVSILCIDEVRNTTYNSPAQVKYTLFPKRHRPSRP